MMGIKDFDAVEGVCTLITEYVTHRGWRYDDFFITSYNHYDLQRVQDCDANIRRIPIFAGVPLGYTQFVRSLQPSCIAVEYDTLTKGLVDDAHAHGIGVHAFTINDKTVLDQIRALGVDAVVTDTV